MALDAAHFLFDRAVDFRAKGWYSKSRPVLAECLAIRESMLAEAGHSGPSIVVQTKFEVAVNLMDMCLWSEAIAPLEACFKARKEAALAKGGGSNGMGNGKHRDLAEVIEAQVLSTSSIAGKKIKDVSFPEGVLVGAILKEGKVTKPSGESRIDEGDVITIFAMTADVPEVERLLQVTIDFF